MPPSMAPHVVKHWKPVMDLETAHPDGPIEVWPGGPKYCNLAMDPGFWVASDMPGGQVPRLYSRVEPSESPVSKWLLIAMRFRKSKKLAGYSCPCGYKLWGPEPAE